MALQVREILCPRLVWVCERWNNYSNPLMWNPTDKDERLLKHQMSPVRITASTHVNSNSRKT